MIADRDFAQRNNTAKVAIPEGLISLRSILDSVERVTGVYIHYSREISEFADSCIYSKGMSLTYSKILNQFLRYGWEYTWYKNTIWIRKRKEHL